MNRNEPLDLCIEYLHQVWWMLNLSLYGGTFALYGLEQNRIELHEKICDVFGIDRTKSKNILSYLDEKLGMDFSVEPSESELKKYGQDLLELLLIEKEEGRL